MPPEAGNGADIALLITEQARRRRYAPETAPESPLAAPAETENALIPDGSLHVLWPPADRSGRGWNIARDADCDADTYARVDALAEAGIRDPIALLRAL